MRRTLRILWAVTSRFSPGLACIGLTGVLVPPAGAEPRTAPAGEESALDETKLKAELNALISARRNAEARSVAKRLLRVYETRLGAGEPARLAAALTYLATALEQLGDDMAAIDLYRRALPLYEATADDAHVLACVNRMAMLLGAAHRYREALPLFQRALVLEQKLNGSNSSQVAVISSNLALAHASVGEFSKAEQLYRTALALVEQANGPHHPQVAKILTNFAGLYADTDQPGRAIPLFERALEIRKRGADTAALALAEQDLALAHQTVRDFQKAAAGYSRAFALLDASGRLESEDAAQVLGNWASLYADQGDFARAEKLGQIALALAEKLFGPDSRRTAHPANNLGDCYKEQGKLDDAEVLYRRAHGIWLRTLGADHQLVGLALNNLGVLYQAKGDYGAARANLLAALAIARKAQGAGHSATATALNNLASLERELGDYIAAAPLLEQALVAFEQAFGANHMLVATALNNLGTLKLQLGNSQRAEELFTRALDIAERAGDRRATARTLVNLAVLYDKRNEVARAEPMFRRAIALLENAAGHEPLELAPALLGLASVRSARGDDREAEALLQRARRLALGAEGPAGPGVARLDASIAHVVAHQGRYPEAELLYARALGALRRAFGDDHPDVAQLYVNQAVMYWEQGKGKSAVAAMQRGVEARERHVSRTLATGSEEERRLLLSSSSGETDWAIDLHEHGFPGDEGAKRLALLAVFHSKGRLLEALQDTNRALRDRLGPDERQLFEQLKAVRARIAELAFASHGTGGPEKAKVALALLGKQADGLEARIAAQSALFRSIAQPVTIERVAKQLPADAALVEVVSHLRYDPQGGPLSSWRERRYSAYVLKSDQSVAYVELGAAQAIDASVAAFREVLRDPESNPVPRARELDELVMRPIRRLVGVTRNLIISGDGALSLVPFGALVDERNHYLIDEWSIRYLATGRELLRPSSGPSRTAALVVANPTFDAPATWGRSTKVGSSAPSSRNRTRDGVLAKFGPLSATLDEGRAVARSLQVPLLSGSEASVGALLELQGPRILHVATHGFFVGDVQQQGRPGRGLAPGSSSGSSTTTTPIDPLLRSGLALAGANLGRSDDIGILTAFEASSLDLWGTRLVVLSACDTGVGTVSSREGVYGLRRSLALAGAESLVMSLWKVNDDATRDLMIAYYDALSRGGRRAASLRDVQLSMRRNARYAHPYYWASFIASGAEGPLGESPGLPPALPRLGSRPPPLPPLGAARGCGCHLAETRSSASGAFLGSLLFGVWLVQRRSRWSSRVSETLPSSLRARRRRKPRNETRSTLAAAE